VSDFIDIDALWRVAALSATFGVGVVGLYALGVVAGTAPDGSVGPPSPLRRAASTACFAVCFAVIAFGVWVMLDK
jgi:hypothetical protein